MSQELWERVDDFLSDLLAPQDPALQAALEESRKAGLPEIQVSSNQGKLLFLLAQLQQARSILELGTLGGYSTIWLARALPSGGRLISLEANAHHADTARRNIAAAGLAPLVEIRTGPALELLPILENEGLGPFDLIFIDADKANTPEYFSWAVRLSRSGGLIFVDNVVRNGHILNSSTDDPAVNGMRRFLTDLSTNTHVDATALQTVGSKGHDGFVLARVR